MEQNKIDEIREDMPLPARLCVKQEWKCAFCEKKMGPIAADDIIYTKNYAYCSKECADKDIEKKREEWIENMKKVDPLWEEKQELGKMLMRHIDDLTPAERKRYDELKELLIKADKEGNK